MKYNTVFAEEHAGIGPCIDVKAHGGRLYAIQRSESGHSGNLCVLDGSFKLIHKYEGIGNARQIEIVGSTAVVSSREDGLWLFDISVEVPKLLCHYLTVEYATGVALYGNLAFISCRQFGVEVIDISNPADPIHIGIINVGEVQSATVSDGILYCGCWGEMKVVMVDVSVPEAAKIICEIPLGGRGDGVCVHNGVLYAAIGQHARGIKDFTDKNDPCFGMGNGVEMYDVSDPVSVKKLGSVMFGKSFFEFVDLWEPAIYGDVLIVNNSTLGVYIIDPRTMEIRSRVLPKTDGNKEDAVTGVTVLDGDLFVSTAYGDLYTVRGLELDAQRPNAADVTVPCTPRTFTSKGNGAAADVIYGGSFPVLTASESESHIVLACAEKGIHILDRKTLKLETVVKTAASVKDAKVHGELIYAAEGGGGVEIFRLCKDEVTLVGSFRDAKSVNQIALSESGKYLLAVLEGTYLKVFDVSDPESVKDMYSYKTRIGLLYGNNIAPHRLANGALAVFCHRDGLITTDPDGGVFEFKNVEYQKTVSFCSYCSGQGIECVGDSVLYTFGSGYILLSDKHENLTLADSLPQYAVERGFRGYLYAKDGILVSSDRISGLIRITDISDIHSPRLTACVETNASVSNALISDGRILVPGGRMGLLLVKLDA